MRVALIFPACFALIGSDVLADAAACTPPTAAQPQGKFEVWQEPLPAPDYLDGLDACIARTVPVPPPSPPSLWAENQRVAYTNALKKQRVDVLVAPFQTQGYGLERTERAIMSADLAYHFDATVRVADPFLTARALGEGARRYDRNDIVELARAVGARTAIVGYAGHDLAHRMTVTIQVLTLDSGGVAGTAVETKQQDWRGLAFSHADPPFVVFHRMLPSVLESLSLPVAKQPVQRVAPAFPDEASFSFADLATDKHALNPSVALSLVGAMTSSADERSRERLFERALVASWHFDAPGAEAVFLRAYALLNLEHRPAALALINGFVAPEAVALRALLNGNLPDASAAVAGVENPFKRLMLGVQVDDLRHQYEKQDVKQATDAASVFGDGAADWSLLAEGRSNDANMWSVEEPAALKFLLDEVHPVAGFGVQSVVGGVVARAVDDVAVDIATLRHVARFVEAADVPVCCSTASARVVSWDLVSLLEGRAESRMRKQLYLTNVVRYAPEGATESIERYRSVLEGHPLFAAARAEHATQMKEQANNDAVQRWEIEAREQALVAAAWSPGQNHVARDGVLTLGVKSSPGARYVDAYGFDYPRRSHWPYELIRTNAGGFYVMQILTGLRADAVQYSRTDISAFGWPWMGPDDRPTVLAQLEPRLVGHPGRAPLLARLRPPRPPSGDPVADAKAAVEGDPENWDVRFSAGRKLIEEHGKWEEAAELFLAHPYFHRESPPSPVRVSNAAYDAGSLFYWGGHENLAVPFYEIAASLTTGAESQMTSQIRLSILEGHYRLATAGSYARGQRYADAYPFRDLLSFMHALGYGEEAWEGFPQVATAFENPQVWESAFVGQRVDGLTEPEIRAWLKQPDIRNARFRNTALAPRYAVLVNSSDHAPPEDLGALIEELEGEPAGRVVGPGIQERPHPENPAETTRVHRSQFAASAPAAPQGMRIKSEFAFFGAAYAAIRHGRFEIAVQELTAMSQHYSIEERDYSYALPYFALAAAKTGDAAGLEKFINGDYVQKRIPAFDLNLARAFFHGVRKETGSAREALDAALRSRPRTDHRPVLTEYQWAEACEWLYRETGDAVFVDMLLAWVMSQQKVEPTHGWAYAMEYTYAKNPERKRRALAMTVHLDPASPRIRGASADERAEAEVWGAKNNPFVQEEDPPEVTGPTA